MGILSIRRTDEKLDIPRTSRELRAALIEEDPFPISRLAVENLDIDQLVRVATECSPMAITFRSVRLKGTRLSVLMAIPLGQDRLSKEDLARAYELLMWVRREEESYGGSAE